MKSPFVLKEHPLGISIHDEKSDKLVCIVPESMAEYVDTIYFSLLDHCEFKRPNYTRKWVYEDNEGNLFDASVDYE